MQVKLDGCEQADSSLHFSQLEDVQFSPCDFFPNYWIHLESTHNVTIESTAWLLFCDSITWIKVCLAQSSIQVAADGAPPPPPSPTPAPAPAPAPAPVPAPVPARAASAGAAIGGSLIAAEDSESELPDVGHVI